MYLRIQPYVNAVRGGSAENSLNHHCAENVSLTKGVWSEDSLTKGVKSKQFDTHSNSIMEPQQFETPSNRSFQSKLLPTVRNSFQCHDELSERRSAGRCDRCFRSGCALRSRSVRAPPSECPRSRRRPPRLIVVAFVFYCFRISILKHQRHPQFVWFLVS